MMIADRASSLVSSSNRVMPAESPPDTSSRSVEGTRARELDEATLLACKHRDANAFRRFVVQYERMVFALLSRMLGSRHEVEDLAQETFLRAYRALPSFDLEGSAKVSTWLLTIAMRLALDSKKRAAVATKMPAASDGAAAVTSKTPEDEQSQRQLGEAIARAAAALNDDFRAVFVLVEMHHLSMAETGAVLEINENTVKTRLFRAKQQMRERLAEWQVRER